MKWCVFNLCLLFCLLRLWRKLDHRLWNILFSKLSVTLPPKCRVLLEHSNKPRQPALPLLLRFPPGGQQYVHFWLPGCKCLTWKQTWGGGGRGRTIEPFRALYKDTLHDWGPTSLFLVLFVRCMMVTAALLQSWSGCVALSSPASSIRLATSSLSSSVRTVASLQEASWHPTPPVWWHFAELLYHTPKAGLDNFLENMCRRLNFHIPISFSLFH